MSRVSRRIILTLTAFVLLMASSPLVTGPERVRLLVPTVEVPGRAQELLVVSQSGSGSLVTCLGGPALRTRRSTRLSGSFTGAVSGRAGERAWAALFGGAHLVVISTERLRLIGEARMAVLRAWADDLDGDGVDELLLVLDSGNEGRLDSGNEGRLDPRPPGHGSVRGEARSRELAVFSVRPDVPLQSELVRHRGRRPVTLGRFTLVWRGLEEGFLPWQVTSGDVDGDGRVEVGVGVFRKTRFDPEPGNRPYIYTWSGGDLSVKWLGSRLSRPFEDFWLLDLDADGRSELLALEREKAGGVLLTAYRWSGFGFEGLAESPVYGDVFEVIPVSGRGHARVMLLAVTRGIAVPGAGVHDVGARPVILSLQEDRLVPVWEGPPIGTSFAGGRRPVNPSKWPLALVDLEGDGRESIVAGFGARVRIIGKLRATGP